MFGIKINSNLFAKTNWFKYWSTNSQPPRKEVFWLTTLINDENENYSKMGHWGSYQTSIIGNQLFST